MDSDVDLLLKIGGDGSCASGERDEVSGVGERESAEQAHGLQLQFGQCWMVVSCRSSMATYFSHGSGPPWSTESRSHWGVTTAFVFCLGDERHTRGDGNRVHNQSVYHPEYIPLFPTEYASPSDDALRWQ